VIGGLLQQGRNIGLDSIQEGAVLLEDSTFGGADLDISA
jgi:hypothetical protein